MYMIRNKEKNDLDPYTDFVDLSLLIKRNKNHLRDESV